MHLAPTGAFSKQGEQTMSTTFASHDLLSRPRSYRSVFITLLALAIAASVYGMIVNNPITIDSVGVRPAANLNTSAIDPALVDALAKNYPPIDQAAAYRAAANLNTSAIDPALVDALAKNYPPIDQAAAYRAAAGVTALLEN